MICPLTLEGDANPSRREEAMPTGYAEGTDGELVAAWRRGEREALRALVDRHRAVAFGLALRLTGDRDRAEDLAQEAFLRALGRLHQYDTARPFRPWLLRILGNLFLDGIRALREEADEEQAGRLRSQEPPEGSLLIESVLALLPASQRALLVLRELAEYSYDELAGHFHIPVGTVRSRLAHAREAFRVAYMQMSQEVAR
jgi:RNA polymerase sigma-70 factor, ECF subfamily